MPNGRSWRRQRVRIKQPRRMLPATMIIWNLGEKRGMFMHDNRMNLEFLSLSQNESFARSVAGAFITQLNPTVEELTDVRTAVSEAVTNAIIHGYGGNLGMVTLECEISGDTCTLRVQDKGVGIPDVELARQPFYTSHPELERSGMGFTLMETFMDEVSVSSHMGEGTTVTMKKTIKRQGLQ